MSHRLMVFLGGVVLGGLVMSGAWTMKGGSCVECPSTPSTTIATAPAPVTSAPIPASPVRPAPPVTERVVVSPTDPRQVAVWSEEQKLWAERRAQLREENARQREKDDRAAADMCQLGSWEFCGGKDWRRLRELDCESFKYPGCP